MSRVERGIAALLLATAVVGGALIPRLLSQQAGPAKAALGGVALAPGPSGVVIEAPAVPTPPPPATQPNLVASPPAIVTPIRFVRVATSPPAPKAKPAQHPAGPPLPKQTSTPPPATAADTPTVATDLAKSNSSPTRPGNGFGDKNHVHTGPPGQASEPAQSGSDLKGSGHGKPVPQATPDTVGAHDRGVGHLAKTSAAAAAAAHAARKEARTEARGASSHGGSSPAAVAHGSGHGHGH